MSYVRRWVGGALGALVLAGCSGDVGTAPESPRRAVGDRRVNNGIHVEFFQTYPRIGPDQSCTWSAMVNGGDAQSRVYTWTTGGSWDYSNGALVEDNTFGEYWAGHATSTGWYELTLTVTDAFGNSGSATTSGEVGLYQYQNCL